MSTSEQARLIRMYFLNLIVELAGGQGRQLAGRIAHVMGRVDLIAIKHENEVGRVELTGDSVDFLLPAGYFGTLSPAFALDEGSQKRFQNTTRDPVTAESVMGMLRAAFAGADEIRMTDDLDNQGGDEQFVVDPRFDQELIEQQQT
ncbi:hypothetical protein ACTOWA_00135 [Herbaspirillum seropedicae]|uniref:hypothetical protein n=1 Tax=Herbaspirillum seropedicae TaxID=964 RepID=UPI0028616F6C|nr:hypothetical protein [Herbaspirillum seropedicae]MDR6398004.1 hypothetical protein [Herbaspirillum seropedicae]